MKDRVPLYPGRVKLTPVAGQSDVYDMTRADQPTQDGDPLNKNTLYKDQTAALYGFGPDSVPDDALAYLGKYAQHWWVKREITYSAEKSGRAEKIVAKLYPKTMTAEIPYASDLDIGADGKSISLKNPENLSVSYDQYRNANNLKGKYFKLFDYSEEPQLSDEIYYMDPGEQDVTRYSGGVYEINGYAYTVSVSKGYSEEYEFVQSSDKATYPESGEKDGYYYQYIGIPFDNAVTAPQIATGSYVGTGKYGSNSPNSLTFSSRPKKVSIVGAYINSASRPGYGQHYNEAAFYCDVISGEYTSAGYGYLNYGGYQYIGGSDYKSKLVGNTLSWYNTSQAENQFNESGVKYYYFAIL